MNFPFIVSQLIAPGAADEIVGAVLKILLSAAVAGLLWGVRKLPAMSKSLQNIPAEIAQVRTDLSSRLDALHTDLRSIEKTLGELAIEQGSSKTRVDGLEHRMQRQESRVDGMIERRGVAVQP